MLKRLYIKDFAIVNEIEISFDSGFQVLTGETGAGKSILVGAMGLLCGDRGQADLVRSGADKAILEAVFELKDEGKKQRFNEAYAIDVFADELIVRREINVKGVSRAFVNDSPVNITDLSNITALFIDLHGQHQHQRLIHPENHIEYLDAFGDLLPLRTSFENAFKSYHEIKKELNRLITKRQNVFEKRDLYTFQVAELKKAKLVEDEMESLKAERIILENSEALFEIANLVSNILYATDESASNQVAEAIRKLRSMSQIDPTFNEFITNLESAQVSIEESGRHFEHYAAGLEFDPARLGEIRNRESEIEWLQKKYQVTDVRELIDRQHTMEKELDEIDNFDDIIEKAETGVEKKRQQVESLALALSAKRTAAASRFSIDLEKLLSSVGLVNARFEIDVRQIENTNGPVYMDKIPCETGPAGIDSVQFNVGLNVGEPTKPLHKVASGGEVSRIMLSIKTLLADTDQIDTLVFDEIDSGISGRLAQIVGKKMHDISRHHQLLVITHLPQIAAQGDTHFTVQKLEYDGRTKVTVQKLVGEGRILEIAKLLGGEAVTPQAMANARELLGYRSRDV
ncbi:MAG: DNA repair protein RecN [Calditrichales bacterium]|nr:MAG: DNA repair protein RecN [Calditrichales bacterium]